MAILSVREFADKCQKKPKDIHVYISRGGVVKHKSGGIDTTNKVNLIFLDKFECKENVDVVNISIVNDPTPEIVQTKSKIIPIPKSVKAKQEDGIQKFATAVELNDLRASKLEQEIIQLTLKNQRLEGEMINLQLVKQVTFEVVNSYRTILYSHAENIMIENMKDLDANNEKITKAKTNLTILFNKGCDDAIANVISSMDRIV